MYLPPSIRSYCLSLVANPLFQQLAPFAVLFLVPLLVLYAVQTIKRHRSRLFWSIVMVFESLGLPFGASMPWNWGSAGHASGSSGHERKKSKKKHPRTRADQIAMNMQAERDGAYFYALVTLSEWRYRAIDGPRGR